MLPHRVESPTRTQPKLSLVAHYITDHRTLTSQHIRDSINFKQLTLRIKKQTIQQINLHRTQDHSKIHNQQILNLLSNHQPAQYRVLQLHKRCIRGPLSHTSQDHILLQIRIHKANLQEQRQLSRPRHIHHQVYTIDRVCHSLQLDSQILILDQPTTQ